MGHGDGFAVGSAADIDVIAGLGHVGRFLDRPERRGERAGTGVRAVGGHIVVRCIGLARQQGNQQRDDRQKAHERGRFTIYDF